MLKISELLAILNETAPEGMPPAQEVKPVEKTFNAAQSKAMHHALRQISSMGHHKEAASHAAKTLSAMDHMVDEESTTVAAPTEPKQAPKGKQSDGYSLFSRPAAAPAPVAETPPPVKAKSPVPKQKPVVKPIQQKREAPKEFPQK
jgi:hypothetical protein